MNEESCNLGPRDVYDSMPGSESGAGFQLFWDLWRLIPIPDPNLYYEDLDPQMVLDLFERKLYEITFLN